MKDTLNKLFIINRVKNKLEAKIDDAVKILAFRYAKAADKLNNKVENINLQNPNSITWEASGGFIRCEWHETWSYGGEDSGVFFIPVEFLTDSGAFKEFIKKAEEAELQREKDREKKEKQEKLKQLKQLQEDLGLIEKKY